MAFSIVSVVRLSLSPQLKLKGNPVEKDWGFEAPDKRIRDGQAFAVIQQQRGRTIKVVQQQQQQQRDDDSYGNPALRVKKSNVNAHPRPSRFFEWKGRYIDHVQKHNNSTLQHFPAHNPINPPAYRHPNNKNNVTTTFSRANRGSGRQKVIYLLHIHKAAGSSMCHMAFRNRLSVHKERNCNVQADQQCCGNDDTMMAQVLYAQHTYWDLVAVEREMYDNMAPEWYDYTVILRNSRTRYYSHWNHVSTIKDRGTFQEWWTRQPDNWNTRMICGPKCSANASKFQITPHLFQMTLDRLALFTDILFVETMNASVSKFAHKYGWSDIPLMVNRKLDPIIKNVTSLSAIGWDPDMSALDDALYEFGQRQEAGLLPYAQYSKEVQRHLDAYFSRSSDNKRNCTNPCCSDPCSGH